MCHATTTQKRIFQEMKRFTLILMLPILLMPFSFGQANALSDKLSAVFSKAAKVFPSDSASLYRFYYKWFPAKNSTEIQKQIKRLEALLTKNSVDRYYLVERNLKLLLTKIVNSKSISKSETKSFITLYSDYDYFSGEALFSHLLSNEDNYNLVWPSMEILAKESPKDTLYISALINLDNHISTNVELAESMPAFIIKAIYNNPEGFLDIYSVRSYAMRKELSKYISAEDETEQDLLVVFNDISIKSINEKHRKAAVELIQNISKSSN
jgi:hypothetical protein